MTTTEPPPPLSDVALDPTAFVVATPQPATESVQRMDPTWRIDQPMLQPPGVVLNVATGRMSFDLSGAIDEPMTLQVTTGHATRDALADVPVASGPYVFAESSFQWQTLQIPTTIGPSPAEARVQLRGDDGTAAEYTIDVVFTDDGVAVSHTDAGVARLDYTRARSLLRTDPLDEQFHWLRIESNAAGTQFWVYASVDSFTWVLLVRQGMSGDMQAAFAATTISFSMTSSGTTGTGSWVVGSINVQPNAMQFAGLYLQDENQAGFSYNRGVWAQFGAPLDGFRETYTYDSVTGEYLDSSGNVHYLWISGLAYAQDDPNAVYAVVQGRVFLFVSKDGGFTWVSRRMSFTDGTQSFPLTQPDQTRLEIFDVAVPSAGEVLVLATAGAASDNPGVYRSTDDGITWTRIASLTEYHPPTAPPGENHVYGAGGMRASSSKVWWAEQTAEAQQAIPSVVPNYHVVWSGALQWFVTIDDKPGDAPVLVIPPLSELTEWTDAEGTVRTGSITVVTLASPGVWQPNVGEGVLWEDGLQTPWQNPTIEGIYGQIGAATPVHVELMWQPSTVPDADVADFWSLTDNMNERNRQIKKSEADPPEGPPPPPLPDLGGGLPGVSPAFRGLWRNRADKPEPVSSRAGIRLDNVTLPPRWDPNEIDYMLSVTPHRPENCADVRQSWIVGPGRGGAKIHVVIYDDIPLLTVPNEPLNSERKAGYGMSGVLSVVVLDADPEDTSLLELRAGAPVDLTSATERAVGASQWEIASGEAGYTEEDSVVIGPPGHESAVTYQKYQHPTWIWEDVANYPTPLPTLELSASAPSSGTHSAGGLWLAALVTFGTSEPDIPDGWTVLEDAQISSDAHTSVLAGHVGQVFEDGSKDPWYGQTGSLQTGAWILTGLVGTGIRQRQYVEVQSDLSPMTVTMLTRPIEWPGGALTVTLPEPTASYWFSTCTVGVYGLPDDAGPSYDITSTTWAVKRANFDGSAAESLGTLVFGADPADPLAILLPNSLQVRPLSDDLALASTFFGYGVWRVLAGAGTTRLWTASQGARPWDAVPLNETTFLMVANAQADVVATARGVRPPSRGRTRR